jgi:hypothetical protein
MLVVPALIPLLRTGLSACPVPLRLRPTFFSLHKRTSKRILNSGQVLRTRAGVKQQHSFLLRGSSRISGTKNRFASSGRWSVFSARINQMHLRK